MTTNHYIDIPNNLFQKIIPFGDGGIDDFSFKKESESKSKRIFITPSSLEKTFALTMSNDISFSDEFIKFNDILNKIPSIQIREYVVSTRLKQLLNLFGAFKQGYDDASKYKINWDVLDKFIKTNGINDIVKKQIIELSNQNASGTFQDKGSTTFPKAEEITNPDKNSIIKIPFFMYYCILTAYNTGFYTIPYDGNLIDQSNGSTGWGGNGDIGLEFGSSTSGIIATIFKYAFGNFRFNLQPQWSPGGDTKFPQITVTFNLFNDTVEAASNNFRFVNNIVAKNKYLQYNFFQQNPAAYDIKIGGLQRFYMCSADIKVESKGVLRLPSDDVIKDIKKYAKNYNFLDDENTNEIIRIPDVYHITMTFESLLPNSLNSHIFRYTADCPMRSSENKTDIGGVIENLFGKAQFDELKKNGIIE